MEQNKHDELELMMLGRTKMALFTCGAMLALAALPVMAQQPMDLKQVLEQALKHNTDVRNAALDQEAARNKVGETRADGLPQISAQGDLKFNPSIATQMLPGEIIGRPGEQVPVQFGTKYIASVSGQVTQKLYDHRFLTGLQAAKQSEELYALLHLQTGEQVLYEVAGTYYKILDLKAQEASVDSQLSTMAELERITKLQVGNQYKLKLDLQRVQVNRQNAITRRDGFTLQAEQQLNYLKVLMGMPVATDVRLVQPTDLGIVAPTPGSTALYEQRTDIKVLNQQIALQDLNIRATRAGYAPTLSAFGNLGWQAQSNAFDMYGSDGTWLKNAAIGATLAIPLFDGGRKHHQIAQQKVVRLQYQADLVHAENALAMEERNAIAALDNSWRTVEAQAGNLVLAEEVYGQTNSLYTEGIAPLTDLLDADQALSDSRTTYHSATLNYKLAELDLLKAQGKLNTLVQ